MEWYHVRWPWLTSKRVARFVSDSWFEFLVDERYQYRIPALTGYSSWYFWYRNATSTAVPPHDTIAHFNQSSRRPNAVHTGTVWIWNYQLCFVTQLNSKPWNHRRRKRGYAGDLTPPTIYVGDIDMYISVEKSKTCVQHVLRCWERQSDGSERKKTLRRPGLRPGPRYGSLQRSHKPPSWWGWAGYPSPRTPSPLSALRASPLLHHSKISSDAFAWS